MFSACAAVKKISLFFPERDFVMLKSTGFEDAKVLE